MCKELENIGLPCPIFDNNSFILKTTVMGASSFHTKFGMNEFADSQSKLPIDEETIADSQSKLPIDEETIADSQSKLPIDEETIADSQSKLPIAKETIADCGTGTTLAGERIKLSASSFGYSLKLVGKSHFGIERSI